MSVIITQKPIEILSFLYKQNDRKVYSSKIAKCINVTYSHTVKIINNLIELGLVKKEKQGRTSYVTLTEKGMEAGKSSDDILRLFLKK